MQTETANTVQLVLLVSCEQFGHGLLVPHRADSWRRVVAAARNAESSRKVLPPSWLDFFQDS